MRDLVLVDLLYGHAVSASACIRGGALDSPLVLVKRRGLIAADQLGIVVQGDLLSHLARGLHLVFDHQILGIRQGERHDRVGSVVLLLDIGAHRPLVGGQGRPLLSRVLVDLDRGGVERALGVHRVGKHKRVTGGVELGRALVDPDGVADMRAVLDLLALLGKHLVRNRYGIATGLKRLVARSGRSRVGDGALVGGRIDHTRLGDGLVLELHVTLVAAQRSGGNGEQRGAVRAGRGLDLLAFCSRDFLIGVVVQGVLGRAALVRGVGGQRVGDHHVLLIKPTSRVVLAGGGLVAVHIGGPGHHPGARVLAAVNV